MALDEELISRSSQNNEETDNSESDSSTSDKGGAESAADRSGELRDASRNAGAPQAGSDFNALKMEAKRKAGLKGKVSAATDKAMAPISKATSGLLKAAWENLITSWGLTLAWIDIHVFLNSVFGNKMFVDLGHEWAAGITTVRTNENSGTIPGASKTAGLVEKMGCGCLNLGCLIIVLLIAANVALILGVISNPFKALASLASTLWGSVTGTK